MPLSRLPRFILAAGAERLGRLRAGAAAEEGTDGTGGRELPGGAAARGNLPHPEIRGRHEAAPRVLASPASAAGEAGARLASASLTPTTVPVDLGVGPCPV